MILVKIALRNLSRQKRRSILLGGALSFGMLMLVVVNGITGGLVSSIQKNFSGVVAGHLFFVQVEKGEDDRTLNMIKDDAALLAAVKAADLGGSAISRRTTAMGSLLFSGESATRQITGVDWNEETALASRLNLLAGDPAKFAGSDGIVISASLAEILGLLPKSSLSYAEKAGLRRDLKVSWKESGRKFDLEKRLKAETLKIETERKARQKILAPGILGEEVLVELKTVYGQDNVGSFRVAGICETQMDISAYVDRETLNDLVGMTRGQYNLFGLTLDDPRNLEAKTRKLHSLLEGSYDLVPADKVKGRSANSIIAGLEKDKFTGTKTIVTNLNNELGSIVTILSGVQAGSFILFLVVLAVIMVGLVNTFRMVIYERTREIGTMRALGAQRGQVRNLFLLEAIFLAVAGTVPGALAGILVLNLLHLPSFTAFTELGYFMDNGKLAFTVSPVLIAASFLVVILFTLLAALMPSRKAAKLQPAQALRTQF